MLPHEPPARRGLGEWHHIMARLASVAFDLLLLVLVPASIEIQVEAQSSQAAALDAQLPDFFAKTDGQAPIDERNDLELMRTPAAPGRLPDFDARAPLQPQSRRETEDPGTVVGELPSAPIRVDLTPFLTHFSQAAEGTQPTLQEQEEHYHWKGLLWQSFAFFGVENSFRLMTDEYFRYLTADKPFWHDYIASVRQWNMGRWSDGDDFLVAYVGHPMQGAITSFIEIQNDPHDRFLEISATRAYWMSRFKGFLWNTVYSTDQKVGPLGETALGSEGGYTYVAGCHYPCGLYLTNPKYTNNTGWVKLISTPVVGTIWGLGEDFLDRYVSDRVQEGRPDAVFPKILRGSLNPCRTMANALRLKTPWYRDFQHTDDMYTPAVHFISEREQIVRSLPRFEIFPHFNALSLPINTEQCSACRRTTIGSGTGFSYRFSRWFDLDSDLNYQPEASPLPSYRAGGSVISGTFGFRVGIQTPNYALKAAVRPGFVSYDHAYFLTPATYTYMGAPAYPDAPPTAIGPGRITHFATALIINADYGLTRHFALRAAFGNTAVRYKTSYLDRPPGRGSPPYLYFISPNVFATNENWTFQIGPVIRF
jgi:hypothetical protein